MTKTTLYLSYTVLVIDGQQQLINAINA